MKYKHLEDLKLPYGVCPVCKQSCQPEWDDYNDTSYEFVSCPECDLLWVLYHDDIALDDNDVNNLYRIGEIQDR